MAAILAVDDEKPILELIKKGLQKDGHTVTGYPSAEQVRKEQIAALAHDFKTPLTVVQGNADLLNETKLDAEQHLYTEYIQSGCQQMEVYLKALIDLSQEDSGYPLKKEEIDLDDYLKRLRRQMEALCQTSKTHLQMEVRDLPATMRADSLLLERAILNVVNNALDYSPQGSFPYVLVTGDDNTLQLSVTDTGKGFSKQDLIHAQEPFYRADQSRSSGLHMGLGLFIAQTIVHQHGGELILANSEKTGGAKVTIRIPYE